MTISDGQIALGILQIVALTLPVLALLAQVFFKISDQKFTYLMGYLVLAGGGALVGSAIFSAHFLWNSTNSSIIIVSIGALVWGLMMIAVMLYFIYRKTKDDTREDMRSLKEKNMRIINELEEIITKMESTDTNTVSELRDQDVDHDDYRDELTLKEAKELLEEAKERSGDLDDLVKEVGVGSPTIYRMKNRPMYGLKSPHTISIFIMLGTIYFVEFHTMYDMSSPLGYGFIGILAFVSPPVLKRLYSTIQSF